MNLFTIDLPDIKKIASGKVREIFDLGDQLLFVASDRLSAFDCIFPNPIPDKGRILTQISAFWFEKLNFVPNHFITADFEKFPASLKSYRTILEGRSMLVKKAQPLPVECVVRGYLIGGGWKEYQTTQSVSGIALPPGLPLAARLPEVLFTPSTKAVSGHDEPIRWEVCCDLLGKKVATKVRDLSLQLYKRGCEHAASSGILIADTKFEFGILEGEVVLIDECLTPDSSRFWAADTWIPGENPASYDKQLVRDYLESTPWDKTPPAPALPEAIIAKTSKKYKEVFEKLMGHSL